MAGQVIECPACERHIAIPAPVAPVAAEPVPQPAQAPAAEDDPEEPEAEPERVISRKAEPVSLSNAGGRRLVFKKNSIRRPAPGMSGRPLQPKAASAAGRAPSNPGKTSAKSRLAALLFLLLLGGFGAHRFYVGKTGTAIVFILTFGGLGVWSLVDLVMILAGSFCDKQDLPLTKW